MKTDLSLMVVADAGSAEAREWWAKGQVISDSAGFRIAARGIRGWDDGVERLNRAFFEQDPVTCARELVGCHLRWDGCEVRIVETEAYDAVGDEACHTWSRPSAREFVARHRAGDAYVYLNYGMHWLFNLLVKGGAREGFVLLRAVEPVLGVEAMRSRRGARFRDADLGSGPAKLTQALGMDGTVHGCAFLTGRGRGIFRGAETVELVSGPRIGISKALDLRWRFGDAASDCLSRKFQQ